MKFDVSQGFGKGPSEYLTTVVASSEQEVFEKLKKSGTIHPTNYGYLVIVPIKSPSERPYLRLVRKSNSGSKE